MADTQGVRMPGLWRDGVRLSYDDRGQGPPVVLHTGGCGDSRMWALAGWTDRLAGDHRVLALDHRGRGRSGRPPSVTDHTREAYVADVIALLEHVGEPRAAFVGYSDGAQVGYALAAAHPERVAALVGLGAVGGPEEDEAERLGVAASLRADGLEPLLTALAEEEAQPAPDWLLRHLATTEVEMFALQQEAWAVGPSSWELFSEIRCPTLVVVGELEEPLAGRHAADAAALMADGEHGVIDGCGHLQVFWDQESVGPIVLRHLEGRAGA